MWMDTTVSSYLRQFEGSENFFREAKSLLLKWSFVCSSVVRDLTLRSAQSFGSFHLVRLLFEDYMYFLIEHRIANEYKITPLATMSVFDVRNILPPSALATTASTTAGSEAATSEANLSVVTSTTSSTASSSVDNNNLNVSSAGSVV
jgi:hypothetical protein